MRPPRRDKQKDYSLVGKTITGKYKLLEVLGQGGFGTVYLVEITAGMVGEKLAMKILPEELSSQPSFRNQFLNEIRIAMRVVDKYIAQIRDVGATEDGLLYYTMDLCLGVTLAQVISEERKLPITRTLLIVLNVLRGVQTAHACGIVHRDLKPANIMVYAQGGKDTVRILDFGIAIAVQAGEKQKGFAGSPHYMPPEQFLGEQIGFYTDLYAIGVILYECITGEKPYPGSTAQEVFKSLKTKTPSAVNALAPEVAGFPGLSELVMKAMEKNPERRFQSARELFDAVNGVLTRATAPSSATATSPVSTARSRAAPAGSSALSGGSPGAAGASRSPPRRIRKRRLRSTDRPSSSRAVAVALATLIIAVVVVAVIFHKEIAQWWTAHVQEVRSLPAAQGPATKNQPQVAEKKVGPTAAKKDVGEKTVAEQKAVAATDVQARAGKLVEECKKAIEQNEWATAVERADALIGFDPENPEAYRLRGQAAMGLRDFKTADAFLEKARSLAAAKNGGDVEPSLLSALAEAKMGLSPPALSDAEALLREAIRKAPKDGAAIVLFARILDTTGKRADAKRVLQAARQGRIDSPAVEEMWQRIATEDAGKLREEALKLAEAARDAYDKGDRAKAVDLAAKSRELTPTTLADIVAADGLVELGRFDEAAKILEEALARRAGQTGVAPSQADAARIEGRLGYLAGLGLLAAEKDGAPDQTLWDASAAFKKAALSFPKDADAKQQLRFQMLKSLAIARTYAQRGDAARTESALQALEKEPSADVLAEEAKVHLVLARKAEAKEAKAQACGLAKRELQSVLRAKDFTDELRGEVNYLLGTAQMVSGDLEKNEGAYALAISSFAAAEKAGLKTKELYESWAEACDRAGKLIKAAQLFRNVYEIDPSPETCIRAVDYYLNANPKSPEAMDLIRQGKDRFKESKDIQRKYEELTR